MIQCFREQAERAERLAKSIDDTRTRDALTRSLSKLIFDHGALFAHDLSEGLNGDGEPNFTAADGL
jgi:hypothetical protein